MASDNDMKAHQQTYIGVMGLLKWGSVASFIIGAIVVLIIAR
jgi:Bacterial aa3 type cytochrome c oxidase subunit IV